MSIGLHEIRSLSKRSTPAHDTECRSKAADSKQQERTRTRSGDTSTCDPRNFMMRATQQISDGTKTKVVVALVRHGVISSINRISPTELMMTELEENLKTKRVELESAKTYLSDLKKRFCSDSVIIDKTIPQCSKCHLRDGHSSRRCPWGECQGP